MALMCRLGAIRITNRVFAVAAITKAFTMMLANAFTRSISVGAAVSDFSKNENP